MSNYLLLAFCLFAGIVMRQAGRLPDNAHTALNAVIIHVSLPALTVLYLHRFTFDASHILPVLMPWVLFALGAVVFFGLGRAFRLRRETVGALTLLGGFGNTSFVGLPMIESLYGRDGMPLGMLIDQLGSYLALSTVGVMAAAIYAGERRLEPRAMLRKVLTFPPFIAIVLALLLIPVPFPAPVEKALARMGDTLAPLALLSVGMQLQVRTLREDARALCLGLGYKLLVCPALAMGSLYWLHSARGMVSSVTIIEAAMPPMIGAGIVASQSNLDARLVSMMIGIGIPLAFVTVPAWSWVSGMLIA
jgi:predicted permease